MEFNSKYLKVGSEGSEVTFFQRLLKREGGQTFVDVDGIYGPDTKQAVKNWQLFFGLYADGELGPITQGHVISVCLVITQSD